MIFILFKRENKPYIYIASGHFLWNVSCQFVPAKMPLLRSQNSNFGNDPRNSLFQGTYGFKVCLSRIYWLTFVRSIGYEEFQKAVLMEVQVECWIILFLKLQDIGALTMLWSHQKTNIWIRFHKAILDLSQTFETRF